MSRTAADQGRLVYVGNLPEDVRERDLDDLFYKFGRIANIDVKRPVRPPYFAFVEFDDRRDADDAVHARDGIKFCGSRLRVELAKGSVQRNRSGRSYDGVGDRVIFEPRNTGYRVLVKDLPSTASWQDLKDFVRQAVRPVYTKVESKGEGAVGLVEFESRADMERAIRKLDDTEFKNLYDKAYVRVVEDTNGGGGGSSRKREKERPPSMSPSRSRRRFSISSRSRSRSPARGKKHHDKSRSTSRSPSPDRNRNRSPSPSRMEKDGVRAPAEPTSAPTAATSVPDTM